MNRNFYAPNEPPRQVSMGPLFDNLEGSEKLQARSASGTKRALSSHPSKPFDGGERSSLAPVEAETNNRALCQTRDITWSGQKQDDPPSDICKNRHKGNPNSVRAFESVSKRLTESQNRIWNCIKDAGERGRTNDEICVVLGLYPNEVSGRITELHLANRIEEIGKRPTRRKCPASVWRTI